MAPVNEDVASSRSLSPAGRLFRRYVGQRASRGYDAGLHSLRSAGSLNKAIACQPALASRGCDISPAARCDPHAHAITITSWENVPGDNEDRCSFHRCEIRHCECEFRLARRETRDLVRRKRRNSRRRRRRRCFLSRWHHSPSSALAKGTREGGEFMRHLVAA